MKTLHGTWYDGKTSCHVPAIANISEEVSWRILHAENHALLSTASTSTIQVPSRIGNTPRFISFPCGGKFKTTDHAALDGLMGNQKSSRYRQMIYALESKKSWVLLALVTVMLVVYVAARFGVPATAKSAAFLLPPSVGDLASKQAIAMLDKSILAPSELEDRQKEKILQNFTSVFSAHPAVDINIAFRKGGPIGANAFALPSGTILFTDEMIELAEHEEELMAVLAHEIGHVAHRHGLRMIIQDSLLAFIVVFITGDASGVADIFMSLPIVLTERAYSRGFEEEADLFAREYLNRAQIPLCRFAALLERIETHRLSKTGETQPKSPTKEARWHDYLSTHPDTKSRIAKFQSTGCEKRFAIPSN